MHTAHYSGLLVELSYLVAVLGAFTALQLAMMIPLAQTPRQRAVAIGLAGLVMGAGAIWAMHFIGMLAFDNGMPVSYDLGLTVLSALVAVLACTIGFALASRGRFTPSRALHGGFYMGLGIAAMHYLGMAAMRMPASLSYRWEWLALSVLVAIIAAVAALWLAFVLRGLWQMTGSALVMGVAICGMHYIGMVAARFQMQPMEQPQAPSLPAHDLGLVIFAVVSVLLLATLLLHRLRLRLLQRAFVSGYTRSHRRVRSADDGLAP